MSDRRAFLRKLHEFIDVAGIHDLLFVNLGMGYGKSVSTWDLVTRVAGYRAIMLNPRHDNILDTFVFNKRRSYNNFIHLQGRDRPGMCCKPEVIELSKIIPVSSICDTCDSAENCVYLETRKRIMTSKKPVMGVHAHGSLIADLSFSVPFDCCIIDENPISTMLRSVEFQKRPDEIIDYLRLQQNPLYDVADMMFQQPINYVRLANAFSIVGKDHFRDFEKSIIDTFKQGNPIPKGAYMVKELELVYDTNGPIESRIYLAERWEDNKMILHLKSFDRRMFDTRCPIIVLDATGSADYYRKISGRPSVDVITQRSFSPPSNIRQIIDGKYAVTTIVNRNGNLTRCGNEHIKFIKEIIQHYSKRKRNIVTIASSKRFKQVAEKQVGKANWIFFYGNRGTNTVMNISDVLIIAMCPNIPDTERKTNAKVTPISEDEWDKILIQEEIKQTVGRIRLELDTTESGEQRDERVVIILTNVDLGYKTFTKYQVVQMMNGIKNPGESPHIDRCITEIMNILVQPMTMNMIVKAVGRSRGLIRKSLNHLVMGGEISCRQDVFTRN